MLMIDKAHVRGLWVAPERVSFCSSHLRSVSRHVSLVSFSTSNCHMTASQLAFGSYPWICENVARAAGTLWSWGSWLGGALVSALCICCFLTHRFPYGTFVICVSFMLPVSYQSLGWYNDIIYFVLQDAYELISWSPTVLFFGLLVLLCFLLFCFVWFFVSVLLPFCFCTVSANGLCTDPVQFSFVCTLSSRPTLPQL